ncbi:MAG: type toxin-antitoxin system VapC family toxin [Frondihabitans sp.]|nr:type toxin-antitoxin system VapC family toxin [Frondihabitans sp.]
MILLDTNVVSEMMRPRPDPGVLAWLDAQDRAELHLAAMTAAELLQGVFALAKGRRARELIDAVGGLLDVEFRDRILPFDADSALEYAHLMVRRSRRGRPMPPVDGVIAATALSRYATVATRNIRDFEGVGLDLIDPWSDRGPSDPDLDDLLVL